MIIPKGRWIIVADIGKTTSVHPAWLDTIVPSEYEDEGLYEIILFFVLDASTGFLGAFTGIFKVLYKKKNPLRGIAPRTQREQNVFVTQSS